MSPFLCFVTALCMMTCSPALGRTFVNHYIQFYDFLPQQDFDSPDEYPRDNQIEPSNLFHQEILKNGFISDFGPSPPPHDQVAKMARYIVHKTDWAAIATHATSAAIRGFPFANIVSISDGPINNSSGIPYLYITTLEPATQDLEVDPRCSLALSLAQTDYCKQQKLDPEDPRCAKVILTGRFMRVKPDTSETAFAQNALFTRHPIMSSWPKDHGFFFAKLKIEQIFVQDFFGGPSIVPLNEYFNAGDNLFR